MAAPLKLRRQILKLWTREIEVGDEVFDDAFLVEGPIRPVCARLDAALALLTGDSSIADIAHACGYADHSAFTRQFRRSTGFSPREYRALRR